MIRARLQHRRVIFVEYTIVVLVGADAVSAKVAHSYFLMVGNNGNILTSAPKITKVY